MFFRGSRYEPIPEASLVDQGWQDDPLQAHAVRSASRSRRRGLFTKAQLGDRPDLIAFRTIGDPEQFWRLCDLNLVRRPVDLTAVPGAPVAIPAPEGGG